MATNSPIDLGKLIIDGNHAILSNDSSSGNQGQLVKRNPVTNLTDDQAMALSTIIKSANKDHATEAYQQMGHDNAAALVALHNITSPNYIGDSSGSNGSSFTDSKPKSQAQVPSQTQSNNLNPLTLLHNLVQGAVDIIPTSPDAKEANIKVALGQQKMAGQEPIQQADIEKMALETQQKINQATMVPPTQAEKMSNAAAYVGYKTTALKDMLDNTDKSMAQQNDMIKNMQGYSSWFNKPFGTMPKEAQQAVKKLKQLQLERIAVSSELNKHQQLLASGGTSNSPFLEGQIYTDAQGNKATYKNGKFQ